MSSVPSSMMVRSAVKLVSNTLSKPARRRAVFISKVTGVPGSRPNSSPMADARRGGRLDDDVLVGVVDGGPHLVGLVLGVQGAGRAAVDALAAVDADDVAERHVLEGLDGDLVAAADGLEHADFLHVDAGADAAAAADALVHVAHHGVARGSRPRTRARPGGRRGSSVMPYSSASDCSSQLPLRTQL